MTFCGVSLRLQGEFAFGPTGAELRWIGEPPSTVSWTVGERPAADEALARLMDRDVRFNEPIAASFCRFRSGGVIGAIVAFVRGGVIGARELSGAPRAL